MKSIWLLAVFLISQIVHANAHGRLLDPPARSSAWREDPTDFPINYDDNAMFCGGFNTEWNVHGGKCGICGGEYGKDEYVKGGSLYRGKIVRTYTSGDLINVEVEITANHLGYFEFRLCNTDDLDGEDATQECLDKTLLKDNSGNKQYKLGTQLGMVHIQLRLPTGFVCKHCVFQWKYNAGNSWNVDPVTNKGCIGCGPQEQFYGCADITINEKSKREKLSWPSSTVFDYLPEKNSYTEQETSVAVPESLLKRLVQELKRLKQMESQYIQEETSKEISARRQDYDK